MMGASLSIDRRRRGRRRRGRGRGRPSSRHNLGDPGHVLVDLDLRLLVEVDHAEDRSKGVGVGDVELAANRGDRSGDESLLLEGGVEDEARLEDGNASGDNIEDAGKVWVRRKSRR